MRNPTLTMIDNLRWTRSGTVWADYVIRGVPYGFRPTKDLVGARTLHAALFRSLPGESLLMGICAGQDPSIIVDRMIAGVDLEECPDWRLECQAMLEWLDTIGPGQRIYWLSVPLSSSSKSMLQDASTAALGQLRDRLGLSHAAVSDKELQQRREQSARILERIPQRFGARPATPAQMVWLGQHALHRGLYVDRDLPMVGEDDMEQPFWSQKSGAAMGEPLLDEGALSDLPNAKDRLSALSRRVVKITDPGNPIIDAPSYQVLGAISDTPDGGVSFPGGELLGKIDTCGLEVDWAMRLNVIAGPEVRSKNQRALGTLMEQINQRDGSATSALNPLSGIAGELTEYASTLENDKLEVETQSSIIFAVGGATYDEARQAGVELAAWTAESGYKLDLPLGEQEQLWWAMQPGVPAPRIVRDYQQITTAHNLAALVPYASVHVGDTKGSVFALNISNGPLLADDMPCGPTDLVFHDLEGAADRNVSGSMAIAGELGAGKTATLMKLASDVVDKAGQLVIADRTSKGEWAAWARPQTKAVIVDPNDTAVSLDPLRAFGPELGCKMAMSFLGPLLGLNPTSEEGVLLADVMDAGYLAEHGLDSMEAVWRHLESDCEIPGAHEVFRKINVFARRDYGRLVFDSSLPKLDIEAGAIVIRTHTVSVPSTEEIETPHLFAQLDPTKIFGRALNALIAATARQICFRDTSRLAGFVVSEAHAMTSSHEGVRELIDLIRDGRKHRAVVMLDSHDPMADFGSVTLRGLIPARLLMRHTDKALAARGLEWLDLDPSSEELLEMIRTDTSPATGADGKTPSYRRGEGLFRDLTGNIGRIKVLLPARQDRRDAITLGGTAAARTTSQQRRQRQEQEDAA